MSKSTASSRYEFEYGRIELGLSLILFINTPLALAAIFMLSSVISNSYMMLVKLFVILISTLTGFKLVTLTNGKGLGILNEKNANIILGRKEHSFEYADVESVYFIITMRGGSWNIELKGGKRIKISVTANKKRGSEVEDFMNALEEKTKFAANMEAGK